MKILLTTPNFKKIISAIVFCLAFTISWAQDKGADVNVKITKDSGSDTWYMQPWVWVVGAAVFILLLIALLRGNGNKN